jgi:formate-dependent nitrite reductase cytochrome c552 subunit
MADLRTDKRALRLVVITAVVTAVVAVATLALLINIFERKQEARNPFYRVVELTDETVDPEIWGKNFPMQYDAYKRTVDQKRTRYGGSEAVPRTPTDADPRSIVAQSRLEDDPRLKTMWAGYAFSRDSSPSARSPPSSPAPACTATLRSMWPTSRPAAATSSRASRSSTRCRTPKP